MHMKKTKTEFNLTRIIAWSSMLATLLVTSWWSSEPVNYGKMLMISIGTFALLFSSFIPIIKENYTQNKVIIFMLLSFILFSLLAMISSSDPISQNFYGVFGRNTGFLTYFCLAVFMFFSLGVTLHVNFKKILRFFLYAGAINVIYCMSVLLGYDPIAWENIYGVPLGTLGNPNFIGAFLGFFFAAIFALILDSRRPPKIRLALGFCLVVIFVEIDKTNAVQGLVVAAIGIIYLAWLFLRSKGLKSFFEYGFLAFASVAGFLGIFGTLQIGPLQGILYKDSLSLRGIYWNAGIRTGLDNFWTGAGMDSYGTWFRRSRDITKLGPDTVTNAAHNVGIDMFASGGIFLLSSYLMIIGFIGTRLLRHLLTNRKYDSTFAALSVVWICYQIQSIISINQVGVAIWGWVFGGLLVAYTSNQIPKGEALTNSTNKSKLRSKTEQFQVDASTVMLSIVGGLAGLLIAIPPFLADVNIRNAFQSQDSKQVIQALQQWPLDPNRLSRGVRIFAQNELNNEAYYAAKLATEKFPNDYTSWFNLGVMPNISPAEKSEIEMQLKRLDPSNTKRPW